MNCKTCKKNLGLLTDGRAFKYHCSAMCRSLWLRLLDSASNPDTKESKKELMKRIKRKREIVKEKKAKEKSKALSEVRSDNRSNGTSEALSSM